MRISEEEHVDFVRQLIRAHDYWRMRRLGVDLVVLNERASSYAQDLQTALDKIVHTFDRGPEQHLQLGHIYLVRSDVIGTESAYALRAAARVDLSSRRGSLADQLALLTATDCDARQPTSTRATAAKQSWRRSLWRRRSITLTVMADFPLRTTNTLCSYSPTSQRPHPGSMSSPTKSSVSRYRQRAVVLHGR